MKIMEGAEKPKRGRKPKKATMATSGVDLLSASQGMCNVTSLLARSVLAG